MEERYDRGMEGLGKPWKGTTYSTIDGNIFGKWVNGKWIETITLP